MYVLYYIMRVYSHEMLFLSRVGVVFVFFLLTLYFPAAILPFHFVGHNSGQLRFNYGTTCRDTPLTTWKYTISPPQPLPSRTEGSTLFLPHGRYVSLRWKIFRTDVAPFRNNSVVSACKIWIIVKSSLSPVVFYFLFFFPPSLISLAVDRFLPPSLRVGSVSCTPLQHCLLVIAVLAQHLLMFAAFYLTSFWKQTVFSACRWAGGVSHFRWFCLFMYVLCLFWSELNSIQWSVKYCTSSGVNIYVFCNLI